MGDAGGAVVLSRFEHEDGEGSRCRWAEGESEKYGIKLWKWRENKSRVEQSRGQQASKSLALDHFRIIN